MDDTSYPSPKTLVSVWIALLLLSAATMVAGRVNLTESIGVFWMLALMCVVWLKAMLIMRYYLDLRSAAGGWGTVFNALTLVIVVIVAGLYLVSGS